MNIGHAKLAARIITPPGRVFVRTRRIGSIAALVSLLAGCAGEAPASGEDTGEDAEAIVNGWTASDFSEHASIAQILSLSDAGNYVGCTGTLIDPSWVVTAVHCVTGGKPYNSWVRIGNLQNGVGGEYHNVTAVRLNPEDPVFFNDVALLHLDTPSAMPVTPLAEPADQDQWEVGPGQNLYAIATGWGGTDTSGTSPATLQRTVVKIDYVPPASDPNWFKFIQVSTGIGNVCQGDSGGPLLVTRADGTPGVAGVLSAANCGVSGKYTRVGAGVNHRWIRAQLRTSLQTLDFDGDGTSDVFTAQARIDGGYAWFYSSGGSGDWSPLAWDFAPLSALRFGDFDGDGKTDVFAASPRPGGGYQWKYSSGGVSDWTSVAWSYEPIGSLRFGDFDGDGKTDVFTASPRPGGGYQWKYSSGGVGGWTNLAWSYESLGNLRFGDFDADGTTDVFTATALSSGAYQWKYSSGGVASWASLASAYEPLAQLRFADFDGDGKTDVFTATPHAFGGYQWKYSSGGAKSWTLTAVSAQPLDELRFGDFDGDGLSDGFTASPTGDTGYRYYSPGGVGDWVPLAWSAEPLGALRVGYVSDQ